MTAPTLSELTRASLRVGFLGFGGPAGQIALMHRIFVEEKGWINEERYLHALNYCMLLPGPEAQQLATYVGWTLHGVKGGIITGTLFVLPGALLIFAIAWAYGLHADLPTITALLWGVKVAVLAVVAEALVKIGKRALKTRADTLTALAAFLALYGLGLPFPLVVLLAGLVGALAATTKPAAIDQEKEARQGSTLKAALLWAGLWTAPLAAALVVLGPDHILSRVGILFSKLAVVTFGGAYAVLAYLQQQAVDVQGWMTGAQMIDGLGLAETTPGPLVLVNQFVGFMAGWQAENGGLGLAALTAFMASWCTFAPSFLWIFAGAPHAEKLRRNQRAAAGLRAITAAVLGVVASLALTFAGAVLFDQQYTLTLPWGHAVRVPDIATIDPVAAALTLLATFALIRLKVNMLLVIGACALAGLVLA